MNEPHAISALVRKRAELSGELVSIDKRRREVQSRISHVDSVLKMFGYRENPAEIAPRARYTRVFKRGELARMISDYLRTSDGSLANRELALRVVQAKGWDADDIELIARILVRHTRDLRQRQRARCGGKDVVLSHLTANDFR